MIIGIKAGAFSLIHAGHFWMLSECRKQCDYLIVLINDDEHVKIKKGCVPLSEEERAHILFNHRDVDEVYVFHGVNEDRQVKDIIQYYRDEPLPFRAFNKAKFILFHSEELKNAPWVPGQNYVDDIVFIPKQSSPFKNSVSKMFETIRGQPNE